MKSSKVFFAVFLSFMLCLFTFPNAAFAQAGTLGTEQPYIYAQYIKNDETLEDKHETLEEKHETLNVKHETLDVKHETADGNALSSGNYKMQLVLKGVSSFSELEFTASYSSDVIFGDYEVYQAQDSSVNALCKIDGGSIILCFISLNDACTALDSDGIVLFTADITVTSDSAVDMEQVISVSEDPNYFFLEADYADINTSVYPYVYDCYALNTDAQAYNYSGALYNMDCDLSPKVIIGASVAGKIVAMLDPANPDFSDNAPPLEGVQVIIDEAVAAVTTSDGIFTIPFLENGAYEATLHYKNGFNRKIGIIVSGTDIDYTDTPITMVPCDYDNNGFVNVSDTNIFFDSMNKDNLDIADIDGNGYINVSDTNVYYSFVDYSDIRSIYSDYTIY